jgi:hypothetical protein
LGSELKITKKVKPDPKAESFERLKQQYIQAHLNGNTELKKNIKAIIERLGEKVPKV